MIMVPKEIDQQEMFAAIERSLAMIRFDITGRIVWANQNFTEVIGYNEDELIKMHHKQLCLTSFARSDDYTVFWNSLLNNKAFHEKVQRVAKDGSVLWLDAIYTPVLNQQGRVEAVVKIASNITERESILQQSSSEFMSLVEEMTKRTNMLCDSSQAAIQDTVRLKEESLIVKQNVDNIQSISNVVKGITVQSNLLGLNASIEAARAGVQGRGFSVVASEIQKMASKSKEATEQISGTLSLILESVNVMSHMIQLITENVNENAESANDLKKDYGRIEMTAGKLSNL